MKTILASSALGFVLVTMPSCAWSGQSSATTARSSSHKYRPYIVYESRDTRVLSAVQRDVLSATMEKLPAKGTNTWFILVTANEGINTQQYFEAIAYLTPTMSTNGVARGRFVRLTALYPGMGRISTDKSYSYACVLSRGSGRPEGPPPTETWPFQCLGGFSDTELLSVLGEIHKSVKAEDGPVIRVVRKGKEVHAYTAVRQVSFGGKGVFFRLKRTRKGWSVVERRRWRS